MTKQIVFLSPLFLMASIACSDKSDYESRIAILEQQRDSIESLAAASASQYEELSRYITGVGTALDSIAYEEHMLSLGKGEGDRPFTRIELKERVRNFGLLLQRQREYIRSLEDSLSNTGGSASHLLTMISTLRHQLDAKENELAKLRSALRNERASVAQLQESLGAMTETTERLETKNERLEQAMVAQNKAANIGYVLTAGKKKLEETGILSGGGFLKKKKINYEAFNQAQFREVDIRDFTSLTINGKKAKLLTPAPNGSYSLTKSADKEWTLTISSPADFWSVSNYLVIQTD